MSISQQIGSSSLAKPGVCTSTTRPASPYEGQVIYETDTDRTLVWNGSSWQVIGGGTSAYSLVQTLYYTSGTSTFTKASYPWLRAMRIKCQGAGGGGGGCATTVAGQISLGMGGGGGSYAESFITDISSLASSVTITVGAGGTAGSAGNNAGGTGNDSSFGTTVVGKGGGGGSGGASHVPPIYLSSPGSGAVTGTGDLVIPGMPGTFLTPTTDLGSFYVGHGGKAHLGGAEKLQSNRDGGNFWMAGNAGSGYGQGGNGGGAGQNQTGRAGGAGAPGIVILELFA